MSPLEKNAAAFFPLLASASPPRPMPERTAASGVSLE